VNWWYEEPSSSEEREIVVNGEVVNDNEYRMSLVGYNLIIHNVFANDAGVYTCVEETGFGEHHKISLTVAGCYFYAYSIACHHRPSSIVIIVIVIITQLFTKHIQIRLYKV